MPTLKRCADCVDCEYGTLDATDWELLAIEAGMGNVPPEAALEAMDAADQLFSAPRPAMTDAIPAARAVLAMLRHYVRIPQSC